MVRKILRFVLSTIGLLIGYTVADLLIENNILNIQSSIFTIAFYIVLMIVFAIFIYLLSPFLIKRVEMLVDALEKIVINQPKETVIIGFIGFIIGIIIAFLLSYPLSWLNLPPVIETFTTLVLVIVYIAFSSLGYRLAVNNKDDIIKLFNKRKNKELSDNQYDTLPNKKDKISGSDKLLDTSVLIDGRIKPIVETGFVEGKLIVPNFVLEELQLIADSADDLKRERGRRGLDIVKDLQNSTMVNVEISKKNYKDLKEVDIKLLRYAIEKGCTIVTNDFNLNKLAKVQGIKVLNVNELANSVKTIVIPGEVMSVYIVKEGKEKKQGIGYLEDGTMIVVEEARNLIGQEVKVVVTTVLQTAAGKMIFTKIMND